MILLLDLGNTSLKVCAWADGARLQLDAPAREGLRDGLNAALDRVVGALGVPEDCVLCSVVPASAAAVRGELARRFGREPLEVGLGWESDVSVCLRSPETMGLDRYVDAVAAAGLYPGRARVVIDYGTATTYDLVLADGRFVAGLICAGPGTCVRALHEMTALLPLVPVEAPAGGILADNTWDSMIAGNFYAQLGQTRHIVAELKRQAGLADAAVVCTGGYGALVRAHCDAIDDFVPDLMFHGMERLYRFYKGGR